MSCACLCKEIAHYFISWFLVIPMNEQTFVSEVVVCTILRSQKMQTFL